MNDLAFQFAVAAHQCAAPSETDSAYIADMRRLYSSNLTMFLRFGFDADTAGFLAVMLAARMVNEVRGGDTVGRA